jgi:hypothetical protein
MSQAKSTFTISEQSLAFVLGVPERQSRQTEAAADNTCDQQATADAWARFIDEQLPAWAENPSQLEDDDLVAPSLTTISRASTIAASLRAQGAPPPTRIVPTGDGGIAFQYEGDPKFVSIEIEPEGPIEILVFNLGRLIYRAEL